MVGVEAKLLHGLQVVEDRHLLLTHHDEFLLLVGVEPGNEDVGADAGTEGQGRDGDVADLGVQVGAPLASQGLGSLLGEREDHAHVVGRKGPQDIFFTPYFSQIQSVRIDVVNPTQFSCPGHFLQPHKDRMVLQKVTDHENAMIFPG